MRSYLNKLWTIWKREYLLSLRGQYTWKMKLGAEPKVGDVVIIHNENKKDELKI